jgi:hypothetical protein
LAIPIGGDSAGLDSAQIFGVLHQGNFEDVSAFSGGITVPIGGSSIRLSFICEFVQLLLKVIIKFTLGCYTLPRGLRIRSNWKKLYTIDKDHWLIISIRKLTWATIASNLGTFPPISPILDYLSFPLVYVLFSTVYTLLNSIIAMIQLISLLLQLTNVKIKYNITS